MTDRSGATTPGSGSLTVASVVFDSLQQSDPRWTRDNAQTPDAWGLFGYNFATELPASLFPATSTTAAAILAAPKEYQADVIFTPASGQAFRVVFRWTAVPVFA